MMPRYYLSLCVDKGMYNSILTYQPSYLVRVKVSRSGTTVYS